MVDKDKFEGIKNTGAPSKEKIPVEKAEEAGRVYGEGRESLAKLIAFCVRNGIRTCACCAGHEREDEKGQYYSRGYISFALEDEKTREIVLTLFSKEANKGVNRNLSIQRYVNVEERKK